MPQRSSAASAADRKKPTEAAGEGRSHDDFMRACKSEALSIHIRAVYVFCSCYFFSFSLRSVQVISVYVKHGYNTMGLKSLFLPLKFPRSL